MCVEGCASGSRLDTVIAETCCVAACGEPDPAAPNSLKLGGFPSEIGLAVLLRAALRLPVAELPARKAFRLLRLGRVTVLRVLLL